MFLSVFLSPPSLLPPQAFGTEAELRGLITSMHEVGLKAIADIVINHRCATYQDESGKWNKFGGRLAWDSSAICCNNPDFAGKGNPKTGDDYTAAPNIDHSQENVRRDYTEWLKFLRTR
jgi:alpha-amylase